LNRDRELEHKVSVLREYFRTRPLAPMDAHGGENILSIVVT